MSSEPTISVESLGKCYQIYSAPHDRLKQSINARFQRAVLPLTRAFNFPIAPIQYYRQFWALKDVGFDVSAGETIGIIGPNGSGKSTLLQLICGTLWPTTGRVQVRGRIAALLELGSGFNPEFSGRENVYLNGTVLGLTRAQIDDRYNDMLAFADIGNFIDQPVKTYSSGMSMRLAFAVIAHVDADVLIIDEALSVGDAYFQQKCLRWLRQFRKRGTLLFCSHDNGAVINLCQRVVWLDSGRVRAIGPAKEVCEAYITEVYGRASGPEYHYPKRSLSVTKGNQSLKNFPASQNIHVFEFNEGSAWFGTGDATIVNVRLLDLEGKELKVVQGGESAQIVITVRARHTIDSPIIGFYIKDRLGQPLFGDNTYQQYVDAPKRVESGETIEARFIFEFPLLQTGSYSVTAAIAAGTLESHVQHHWLHDALVFEVHSPLRKGVLIAIPMQAITMQVTNA